MEETNPELEKFRQQWQAEVSARAQSGSNKGLATEAGAAGPSRTSRPPAAPRIASHKVAEDHGDIEPQAYHDLDAPSSAGAAGSSKIGGEEPNTALEHYEKAVEREAQGSLGDSLALYRKAYKVSQSRMGSWPRR